MKNSRVRKMTRPLKSGEYIQAGDIFWTFENDTVLWLEVSEDYVGKEFDAALYTPMRRPISNSMEFICSNKKNEGFYRAI